MTEGPDWADTFGSIKRPPGAAPKNKRIGLGQVEEWQKFTQQRALADTAVAMGAVDTGDDFDGAAYIAEQDIPATPTKIQGIKNAIVRGWRKNDPAAVGSDEDVEVILGEAKQVQSDQITLADFVKTRRRVPFWVSPYGFEYVSYPRSELGLESGGKPLYTIPAGTLALTAVSNDEDAINNQVRFIAGGDTPPTHLYCGLYSIDQTTGEKELVWDFGDVRGAVDSGSFTYDVALATTEDLVHDQGAVLAVGILPVGGSFKVCARPRTQIVPDPVIYPQAATELLASQTSLPSTIADSSLDFTSTHRIWASIGQAILEYVTPLSFTLNFDAYDDNENWVSPAVATFKSRPDCRWRIRGGVLQSSGPSSVGSVAFQMGFMVMQKCGTNNMFSEFVVGSSWASDASRASQVYVRCSNNGTSAVGLFVAQQGGGNATVTIQLCTSMTASGTTKATGSDVFSATLEDTFRIEAVEDETTHVTTYTGYRNGDPITGCVWVDSTGLSGVGLSWRRAGFGARTTVLAGTFFRSGGADVVRCGDLSIA